MSSDLSFFLDFDWITFGRDLDDDDVPNLVVMDLAFWVSDC